MPGSHNPLSREDRAQIEGQVLQYQHEIARLNYRLNQDVAFMRLSNELMAQVFVHCAADWSSKPTAENLSALRRWLPITVVCQHWRGVALSTPSLWDSICVGVADRLTSMFLERSSQVHLNVYGHLYLEDLSDQPNSIDPYHYWQPLAQAAFRILSLCIYIPAINAPLIQRHASIPPFSGLRHLDIRSQRHFSQLSQLPSFLISDEIHLFSLNAHFLPFAIIQPLIKASLRCLRLRDLCMTDLSGATVLDVLATLTDLEELELEGGFPLPLEPSTNMYLILGRAITLPRLRSLAVIAKLPDTAALVLHQFIFPGEAAVTVKYEDDFVGDTDMMNDYEDDNSIAPLARVLSQRLSGESALPSRTFITSLRINFSVHTDHTGVITLPSVTGQSNGTGWEDGTVAPTLCIQAQYKLPVLLVQLSTSSAFRDLRSLEVSDCPPWLHASKSIHVAFTYLPSISLVRASGGGVRPVIDAMLPNWNSENQDWDHRFPGLKVLDLREACLSDIVGWDNIDQRYLNLIEQAISYRPLKAGHRLDELVLENCTGVRRELLNAFEEQVRQVTWDGHGLLTDDVDDD
ncbi:hypothetical protein PsYK624_143230 [Phanerochaete sordida]|uniref:F-box domain-containing protein n=1 Tax=Phanerochaete sordida TaxID=48140 RepID=A0A9P3GNT4_9APHY|nr:hypothetical protein PsYK624_143230 [Phanerochaete sordida]